MNDNISQAGSRLTLEGLFKLRSDMKLVPALAESFEANEEATEFIFHLRKGVTFPDGTPFNAGGGQVQLRPRRQPGQQPQARRASM